MEIEIIEQSDSKMRFLLSGVTPAMANALRRALIAEVPKMAIDELVVYENTSALYDEQIALRMALIPIKADIRLYYFPEECRCGGKGCSLCQVIFTLDEVGPKTVYSGDLKSSDPDVKVVNEKIPIVKLKEGQRLRLEAIGRLGIGKKHAKWQSAIACAYKNLPHLSVTDECNLCMKCVKSCPKGIVDEIGGRIQLVDGVECSLCKLCVDTCDRNALKLEFDESKFVFQFESDGSMKTSEMVIEAVNILKDKVEELSKILEGL
jgi:DNA-directed RNA polymerase subunit D